MDVVFSTFEIPSAKRFDAWRTALCGYYVNVDTRVQSTEDYDGFIKEARFGIVTLTDTFLSPQQIIRQKSHLARLDKDCFYFALPIKGTQLVEQHNAAAVCSAGRAALFTASDPYKLQNDEPYRAMYLEFPREELLARTRCESPANMSFNTTAGMGRVVAELCTAMALEADSLPEGARARLGAEALDLLAIAVDMAPAQRNDADDIPRSLRLRQVKSYIEANIANPLLNPERVARDNQMSVRALHYLFKGTGVSIADYIWDRRLERCNAELQMNASRRRTVTEIALGAGFNSMSHFSSAFRKKYGVTPSDMRSASRDAS